MKRTIHRFKLTGRKQVTTLLASMMSVSGGQMPLSSYETEQRASTNNPESQLNIPEFNETEQTTPKSLWSIGPMNLRPRATYQVVSATGLKSAPGLPSDSTIQTFSPGMAIDIGKHWLLDHVTRLQYYSGHEFRDATEHSTSLEGKWHSGSWDFGLIQRYQLSAQPLAETSYQQRWQTFFTALEASRPFSDKWRAELAVTQRLRSLRDASSTPLAFGDSRSWNSMNWVDYQLTERLHAGTGIGAGLDIVPQGNDMIHESIQARIMWQCTEKVRFQVSGGAQFRQMLNADDMNMENAIYAASIVYRPTEKTQLSLNGNQTVNISSFQGQLIENQNINLQARQRLLGKLFLTVTTGYGTYDYQSTISSPRNQRTDSRYFFGSRLSLPMLKRAEISLFYSYGDLASDINLYEFSTTQMGGSLRYRF